MGNKDQLGELIDRDELMSVFHFLAHQRVRFAHPSFFPLFVLSGESLLPTNSPDLGLGLGRKLLVGCWWVLFPVDEIINNINKNVYKNGLGYIDRNLCHALWT